MMCVLSIIVVGVGVVIDYKEDLIVVLVLLIEEEEECVVPYVVSFYIYCSNDGPVNAQASILHTYFGVCFSS